MIGVLVSASAWPAKRNVTACCLRGRMTHGLENEDGNLTCRAGLVPPVACIELDHAVPESLAFGAHSFSSVDPVHRRTDVDLRFWEGTEVVEPRWMVRRPAVRGNNRIVRAFSQVSEGRRVRLSRPSTRGRQQQHREAEEPPTDPAAAAAVDPPMELPEQADHLRLP